MRKSRTRLHTVMLCTRSRGGMRAVVEAYRQAGLFERRRVCLIETHDEGSALHRLWVAAQALQKLVRMLVRGEVELVHAHISMRGSFWRKSVFMVVARHFKIPIVAHLHGSSFEEFVSDQPTWRRSIVVNQLERADRVLVLGERWRDYVLSIAPVARVVVMPNSVRMPERAAQHVPRSTVELLFLGIVGRRKGIYDLLEAMVLVKQKNPSVRLTVGGNGEVEPAREAARRLGIADRVRFTGWVDGAAKQDLLASSDVYVLPSHNEGLPVSILEAMSWNLPVISTSVGSIAELVRDGVDGLITSPGEVAALAEAIVQLAGSPGERVRMGASGRQRVSEQFSEEAVLPRLEQVYDDLLTAGSQPAPHAR